jgi:hypothetical protein
VKPPTAENDHNASLRVIGPKAQRNLCEHGDRFRRAAFSIAMLLSLLNNEAFDPMNGFRCVPIATEVADRFRLTAKDDNGNEVRRVVSTGGEDFPCRHCLEFGKAGETMLLGSYNLPKPLGIYWTPSPIFVHEVPCSPADAENLVAPIVRKDSLVSMRAYDIAHQCLYDLGQVCAGAELAIPIERALSDPRTAFLNVHTVGPGCLLTLVEPASRSV